MRYTNSLEHIYMLHIDKNTKWHEAYGKSIERVMKNGSHKKLKKFCDFELCNFNDKEVYRTYINTLR